MSTSRIVRAAVTALLCASVATQAAVTIDVMFAYDQSAARWLAASETDGDELARRAVEKMNAVLPITHLDEYFSFRLVGTMASAAEAVGEVDYERLDNTVVSVANIPDGAATGAWRDIQVARDAFKADIVVVLIDAGEPDVGFSIDGVSWSLGETMLPNLSRFAPYAYSVCNVRVVDSTHIVTHEVGHVMGAGHSDVLGGDEPGPQLYPYSSAYNFVDGTGERFHTSMGYSDTLSADTGYELYPAFSSAEFTTPDGRPLGDASHDNTRTLRETCGIVAQFSDYREEPPKPLQMPKFEKTVVASCKVIGSDSRAIGLAQITVAKTDKKGVSRVSAAFYGLDGKKKTSKAVKATVSYVNGLAAVSDVMFALKGEAVPLVVTVAANGYISGTFGAATVERTASVGVLSSDARFRVGGMPAVIADMPVLNDVECDGHRYHLLPDGEGVTFSVAGKKWGFAKAAGVKYAKNKTSGRKELLVDVGRDGSRTNLSGLKLSVNDKTGVFKGYFTVYADAGTPERPKLKKFKFTVSGVLADGVGIGRASYKNIVVDASL